MKLSNVDNGEIIKMASAMASQTTPQEFLNEFPTLSKYLDKVSVEDKDKVIFEMIKRIHDTDRVNLDKSDFITLYAHTQAILGMEETKLRLPKLRLLLLNILDTNELDSMLMLIDSIEERINLRTQED